MSVQFRKIICITLLLAFALTGCSGGAKTAQPTQGPAPAAYTQAAETIVAELTKNAPPPATATSVPAPAQAVQPSPTATNVVELAPLPDTSTPLPTATPLPTDTPLPTFTPTATLQPTPTTPPEGSWVLDYQDRLADGFWQTGGDIAFHFHWAYGGYAMKNKTVQDMVWSTRNKFYADSRTEVTGAKISGSIDGYYGITCRYADGSNFYALVVGTDGFFGIAKKKAGKVAFLVEGYDKEGRVYTGGTPNLIRADCVGNTLTLYANGSMLAQVQDTDFSAGAMGLVVGDRAKSDYEVVFTNLSVYVPAK